MRGPDGKKTAGIEDTVRDFWADRPVRPRTGTKLGGVSAALGNRYGIDPVLVRVAFVVGTFYGGAGIVLYLLGWLLLPREGTGRPGESRSHTTSGPMLVLLVLLLIPALFAVTDLAGLFGLILGGLALYLLHRHYRDRTPRDRTPAPGSPAQVEQPTGGENNTWVYPGADRDSAGYSTAAETERTSPPSWDPLGAAPFAWDLPEPGEQHQPEPEPPRAQRRSVTLVTLGLALSAGGISMASGMSPADAVAIGVGVLGTGMVVGAFLHGGRGLIGFAVPAAVLAMLLSVLPIDPWRGFTSQQVRPDTIGAVRGNYTGSVGNIELHLDDLRFAEGQDLGTRAHIGLGNISVHLPPDVDATVRCSTDMGAVDCLGEQREGRQPRVETTDFGADGPGGGTITLDLTAGTGNVEVFRG
ncbi:PspC domain-containing protein [Haloactinomyces albus]|uniref:Phage shock protein PspC (Stress-responsive transcriptional regulator) n=1 Tax=Haloactinomyces albus TaxID=1352928 RepID=A0AAE3ZGH9_9ACTN|nr:PspC domain-containing protein [Haloactinomyces albus]MDR7302564.1 phage shock protein PspC (stress-responsive transcriptional regulator) [Haloactinomyces albus]